MKWGIIVAVFLSFYLFGIFFTLKYRQRKVLFENLCTFCEFLKIEIGFSKNTISNIIETYSGAYGKIFNQILLNYKSLLDNKCDITPQSIETIVTNKIIKPDERALLVDFLSALGRHGSLEEGVKIESKHKIFQNFLSLADAQLKKEASIYKKLFILMGVAAAILLL